MKELENRILADGIVVMPNILRVDSFINHQIDVALYEQMAAEIARLYSGVEIDRIATIEAGGIALATFVSQAMGRVPVVYAKKDNSAILSDDVYSATVHSFTKGKDYVVKVDRRFINPGENVLIVDDFLANGQAGLGLAGIVEQAGARVGGFAIIIEKSFQPGRSLLESQGYRVESLARISSFEKDQPIFH